MSGASRVNETTNPSLALALNPFNSEARANFVVASLNGTGEEDLGALAGQARSMISTSPGDARGYSLLGAVLEREGQAEAAQALYQVALGHSKTEIHALLRLADARLAQSDIAGALDQIDLILRRWPGYWDRVLPILVAATSDAVGSVALARMLDSLPPWRGRAIGELVKKPSGLGFARSLVAAAPSLAREAPGWSAERDLVVGALAGAKAFGEAYGLFLSTLGPGEEASAGYIFDGHFLRPPSRNFFGWRVQRTGATDIALAAGASAPGLRLRFLDSPARPGMVSQNLLVPFGHYRMAVNVATEGLEAPKALFWRLRCIEGQTLARLDIPEGTSAMRALSIEFEVPPTGCVVQTLTLDTEVLTDSWRDRYRGELTFGGIDITRL